MTCDDLLSALELGDAVQQQAARRHAADCPACAAVVDRWFALKAALAEATQLTDQERAIWHAQGVSVRRRRRPLIWASVGAAVAAAVLVLVLRPRPVPPPAPGPASNPPVESLTFSPERSAREFAILDQQLGQFDEELAALAKRIVLADAKEHAAELSDRYR